MIAVRPLQLGLCLLAAVLAATPGRPSLAAAAAPTGARQFVALAPGNVLVRFAADPAITKAITVTGVGGELRGIDVRSADGRLYGITADDRIVVIDPDTGTAHPVSTLGSPFKAGEANGFDFNPQSDRLRLVGPQGQNLRVNVDVGAVAIDGALAYAADDRAAGKRPHITAVAYTNAFARAPSTVMFDIDAGFDTLVKQDPPNDGVLQTIGPLGIDCGEAAGFDIVSPRRGVDEGYAVCGTTLYRIDLATGKALSLGAIGAAPDRYLSLAILGVPPG